MRGRSEHEHEQEESTPSPSPRGRLTLLLGWFTALPAAEGSALWGSLVSQRDSTVTMAKGEDPDK
jgi:hypothetical protein